MNKNNIEYQKGFLTALKIQVNNPVIDDIISNLNAYQEIALSGDYLNVHLTLKSVEYLEKNLKEIQDKILEIYPDDKEEYISRKIDELKKNSETIDEKMKRLSGDYES